MTEVIDQWDSDLIEFEKGRAAKAASSESEEDYEEEEDEDREGFSAEQLLELATVVKDTEVLLEFLSNPDFCRSVTKSLQATINKQLAKLYKVSDTLQEALNAFDETEEEEDE